MGWTCNADGWTAFVMMVAESQTLSLAKRTTNYQLVVAKVIAYQSRVRVLDRANCASSAWKESIRMRRRRRRGENKVLCTRDIVNCVQSKLKIVHKHN